MMVKSTSPTLPPTRMRHRITYAAPHAAALDQRVEQHAQILVGQHDVGGPTRGRRTATADPDAHVGHPDGGGVVGTVADHRGHPPAALQRRDDLHLLFRADAGEDLYVGGELWRDASSSSAASSAPVTTRASDGRPSWRAIARAVTGWSPVISTTLRSASTSASISGRADGRAVSANPTIADQLQVVRGGVDGVGIGVVVVGGFRSQRALRHRQHAQALLGEAVHQRLCMVLVRRRGRRTGSAAGSPPERP